MSLDTITRHVMRPLPRTLAPTHQETLGSYLARLARLNRLDPIALRAYAAGDRRLAARIDLATLARLTGQPEVTLARALPELHPTPPWRLTVIGAACPRCVAPRWTATRIWRHRPPEDQICVRHRLWLADQRSCTPAPLALSGHLGVLAAARRHRRLLRRHSPQRVDAAYRAAAWICRDWLDRNQHLEIFEHHLRLLHAISPPEATGGLTPAALYPQTVALTRLLASPHWSALPLTGQDGLARFTREIRATVTPSYTWQPFPRHRHTDPLAAHLLDPQTNPAPAARPEHDRHRTRETTGEVDLRQQE